MSDREKVIKGLECCNSTSCQKCPYNEKKECNGKGFFYSQAIEDAIALLKEQEALRDYEASIEMAEYCERYEQTYNPEDGSM